MMGRAVSAVLHRAEQRVTCLPPAQVLARFASASGAPVEELAGPSKTWMITRLRHEAGYFMRLLSTATMARIGELLGGRHMSSIAEGIDKVTERAATDPAYRAYLNDLVGKIAAPDAGSDQPARVMAARGVLSDPTLSDADARTAALQLLEPRHGA